MKVFLGGLPRASSTVLCALLNQNPEFHVSPTSPMLEIAYSARRTRTNLSDFRALDKTETDIKMRHVLRGIINSWYEDRKESVCFDKCRGWINEYHLLSSIFDEPKIIVPIRDIRGIMSSMESLRKDNNTMETDDGEELFSGITIQNRVNQYFNGVPVGIALEKLFEAYQQGYMDKMLVIRSEDLGNNPEKELQRVYKYLNIEWFKGHKYTNIESEPQEHDHIHAPYGEHSVHGSVHGPEENWSEMLGDSVSEDIKIRCKWFYEAFYPERL